MSRTNIFFWVIFLSFKNNLEKSKKAIPKDKILDLNLFLEEKNLTQCLDEFISTLFLGI
jgi:hypothetical protein